MKNKRLLIILLIAALILLIPWLAMQFTDEVNWTLFDFMVAGVLLFGTGILCEIALRKISNIKSRIIACAIILFIFFLVWLEIAVGFIDKLL